MRNAKEEMMVVMGAHTPTAASAVSPMPSMFPTYILSTMEYSTFMNCAIMAGIINLRTVESTLGLPRFIAFICRPQKISPIYLNIVRV